MEASVWGNQTKKSR